ISLDTQQRTKLQRQRARSRGGARRTDWNERIPMLGYARRQAIEQLRIAGVGDDALIRMSRLRALRLLITVDSGSTRALIDPFDAPHDVGHFVTEQGHFFDGVGVLRFK